MIHFITIVSKYFSNEYFKYFKKEIVFFKTYVKEGNFMFYNIY